MVDSPRILEDHSFSTHTRDVDLTAVSIMRMAIASATATYFVAMPSPSGVLMKTYIYENSELT